MAKRAIWTYEDLVIARGVDSLEDFARLVRDQGGFSEMHELGLDVQSSPDQIRASLGKVEAFTLSVAHVNAEEWDGSWMYPCAIDDRPGSGYVKVLMAHPMRKRKSQDSQTGDRKS